jgi:hypothetical protein
LTWWNGTGKTSQPVRRRTPDYRNILNCIERIIGLHEHFQSGTLFLSKGIKPRLNHFVDIKTRVGCTLFFIRRYYWNYDQVKTAGKKD